MRGVIYDLQMKRLSKTTWNSYSKRDQKNVWTDSKVRGEEDQEELKKKKSLGKFYRDKNFFFLTLTTVAWKINEIRTITKQTGMSKGRQAGW